MTFRLRYLVPRKDDFNSHAHVERDLKEENELVTSAISTHTLTWSVTSEHILQFGILAYFNSHAHVERDVDSHSCVMKQWISTHTLTWSVTEYFIFKRLSTCISTHTLTWSVTGYTNFGTTPEEFQLTRSRGA